MAPTFRQFVEGTIIPIGDKIVILLYTVAFLFFIWGMAKFFIFSGEKEREKGKKFIFAALIGLAVIASTWGLVQVLINTLSLPST